MAEFAPANVVGNEILDIGSRKARRQRGEFSVAKLASIMGTPGQFDIPNVANVRSIMRDLKFSSNMTLTNISFCVHPPDYLH